MNLTQRFKLPIITSVMVASMLSATGCANRFRQDAGFFIVQSNISQSSQKVVDSEITPTAKYIALAPKVRTVALRAPSDCAGDTAAASTGKGSNVQSLVKTRCGLEMAELERALIKNGYSVLSWNMVSNAINSNNAKESDVSKVTQKLGAQILFQVNSLEKILVRPSRDARITREFFTTEGDGVPVANKEFSEARINTVIPLIANYDRRLIDFARIQGAMLDINAVDAETGQTIWFYRGVLSDTKSSDNIHNVQIYCYNDTNCYVSPPYVDTKKNLKKDEEYRFEAAPANVTDVIYFELIRSITNDFARNFSNPAK